LTASLDIGGTDSASLMTYALTTGAPPVHLGLSDHVELGVMTVRCIGAISQDFPSLGIAIGTVAQRAHHRQPHRYGQDHGDRYRGHVRYGDHNLLRRHDGRNHGVDSGWLRVIKFDGEFYDRRAGRNMLN